MSTNGLVWVNRSGAERALMLARPHAADPTDLLALERAVEAGRRRDEPKFRWVMVMRHGFRDAFRAIRRPDSGVRFPKYTERLLVELLGEAGDDGHVKLEPDQLAELAEIPRSAINTCLIDLEREPIAAITRVMRGRYVRGAQLTPKVREYPPPDPRAARRRRANGGNGNGHHNGADRGFQAGGGGRSAA